ncbi:MAG: hypothetical protein V2J26_04760 [Pacificimonas sp.]|nr:hypothetical protein [Pacificimonas sp.]
MLVGSAAAAATWWHGPPGWRGIVLAVIAFDWAGGIVANLSAPVRNWWRDRDGARLAFIIVLLAGIPVVWWLTSGSALFYALMLLLVIKLSAFSGQKTIVGRMPDRE